jgi:pimeloyl-ACP methyl ester carboxylesterase
MRLLLPLSILVVAVLLLQACSARTDGFRDSAGAEAKGIAILEPVTLGGSQQWLLIRGANASNPVLLFLHGGPGSPYIGLAHTFQRELEKHFVVVQWDQRGSGKSFPNTPPESMTVDQLLADTHELVLLLRQRFKQDKIYLLGHSWGAFLGIMEAKNHPENLYAYIGTGQMIDLVKQERLSHDFVVESSRAERNKKALKQLDEIGYPPYRDIARGMEIKYSWLWEYGGMIEGETGPFPFVKALLQAKEYSLLDISRFVRGMSFSLRRLAENEGEAFWRLKAPDPASGFQVPIFFVTGEHDRVTPLALIAEYENALKAPMKHSFVLKDAGHFAFFTDPLKFSAVMIDILERTRQQRDRAPLPHGQATLNK